MLKNKIQLSKCKDFIGFVQQFVIWEASSLADRKISEELHKMRGLYRQKGAGVREQGHYTSRKPGLLLQGYFLQRMAGSMGR